MSNASKAQGECTNATPEAAKKAAPLDPRRPIRNISSMSTAALRKRLIEAGCEVPARCNKARLIEIARGDGLWNYSGNQVDPAKKAAYGASQSCDDDVAAALKDQVTGADGKCDPDALYDVAIANDLDPKCYSHLNIGMQRMNFGNVLRAMAKRGNYVIIGTTEWNPENA